MFVAEVKMGQAAGPMEILNIERALRNNLPSLHPCLALPYGPPHFLCATVGTGDWIGRTLVRKTKTAADSDAILSVEGGVFRAGVEPR